MSYFTKETEQNNKDTKIYWWPFLFLIIAFPNKHMSEAVQIWKLKEKLFAFCIKFA